MDDVRGPPACYRLEYHDLSLKEVYGDAHRWRFLAVPQYAENREKFFFLNIYGAMATRGVKPS